MCTGSYVHGFTCARRRTMVKAERADGKMEGGREGGRKGGTEGERGVGSESDDIYTHTFAYITSNDPHKLSPSLHPPPYHGGKKGKKGLGAQREHTKYPSAFFEGRKSSLENP
jgi:hypothetical protein